MIKSCAILLSVAFWSHTLYAQDAPIYSAKTTVDRFTKFENFTTKSGLSDNEVTAIFQDSKGYMWFGTLKGLNRFDGYTFKVFNHLASDSLSISCNEVTSIAEDKYGFLWVGTNNGLNKMDVRTGLFTHLFATKSPKSLLKNSSIRALLYTSDGYLWADCKNGILTKIDFASNTSRHFMRKGSGDSDYPFDAIVESKDGKSIIAGGLTSPMVTINKVSNRFDELETLMSNGKPLVMSGASDFAYDAKGNLWIGQIQDVIIKVDAKTGNASKMRFRSRYAIKSDGYGNIWFGGYGGGLAKYSGSKNEITFFTYNQDNPYSIGGDRIFRIFCDRSGCVWVATEGGLSKYSAYDNRFGHYFHIPETESLPTNKITCMAEGVNGIIWIGTRDRGLVCFDRKDERFKTIGYDRENPSAIESPYISGISIDKRGILWLSLWDGKIGGMNSYNPTTGKAKRYKTFNNYRWFSDVAIVDHDEVVAGTWGCGVYFFNKAKGQYDDLINSFSRGIFNNVGNTDKIVIDKDNRVWFSTKQLPFYYNPVFGTFKTFTSANPSEGYGGPIAYSKGDKIQTCSFPSDHYLPFLDVGGNPWLYSKTGTLLQLTKKEVFKVVQLGISIESITSALDGGLWICGTDKLVYYNPTTGACKPYGLSIPTGEIFTIFEEDNFLLLGCHSGLVRLNLSKDKSKVLSSQKIYNYPVRAIATNSGLNVYIGADNGLFRMNSTRNKVVSPSLTNAPLNVFVHSLWINKEGAFFVGTSDGLYYLPSCRNVFLHYPSDPNSLSALHTSSVLSVAQDVKGLVWLGTDRYVTSFDPSTQQFFTYDLPSNDALSSILISDLLFDSKGFLWVGATSNGGLNRVNLETGYIDYFVSRPYYPNGLRGRDVNCIFEDSRKRIWVGTEKGLNMLMPNGRDFKFYDQKVGLLSSDIQSILEDSNGNLWLGTSNGLCCFDPVRGSSHTYHAMDGLQHNIFYPRSATKLRSGELFFGGAGGFNLFKPDSFLVNQQPPQPGISGIWVNGKPRFVEGSSLNSINLKYLDRNISFELSSLDFHNPEMNRFAYKLDGYDTTWIVTGPSGRFVQYTNLSPGHYTFHLKSSNGDGIWSRKEISLQVNVDYPFWQNWWFIVLIIVFLSGCIFAIGEIRERNFRIDRQLLEKTVAERTAEILAQSEEIITQRDTLQRQHNEIERYNSQLSESLEFAKHLQDSHMQGAEELESVCGNHFLIYQPKYLVGGDFYWTANINDHVIFCLVDCTGHGVPGALMSMVGLVAIKDVVLNQKIYDPAEVLENVHQKIVSTLIAGSPGDTVASSMDVAFCVLNRKKKTLVFSGAHCPIFVVKDSKSSFPSLLEIPGDKRLVGSPLFRSPFTNHHIEVADGDLIYLFTDGLVDQLEQHLRRKFSRSLAREMFTEVASLPMAEQRETIYQRIMEWKGTDTQTDDITVFGIKV